MSTDKITDAQLKGADLKSTKTHVADGQQVDKALLESVMKQWVSDLDSTMNQECYKGINWSDKWVTKAKAKEEELKKETDDTKKGASLEALKVFFATGVASGLAFAE